MTWLPNLRSRRHAIVRAAQAALRNGAFSAAIVLGGNCAPVSAEESTATEPLIKYATQLRPLLEARIIPELQRGVVAIAASRPTGLIVDVTDSGSPYSIESTLTPDGSVRVRLSIGYVKLHDAALDALVLAQVLRKPRQLDRYLDYLLNLARENHQRYQRGTSAAQIRNFAQFVGADPKNARRLTAQPIVRAVRSQMQADSLGWVISYLMLQADEQLAGESKLPHGAATGRLAAASGFFPVPPLATAVGIVAIERTARAAIDIRASVCDATDLMDEGIAAMPLYTTRVDKDTGVESIRATITEIRRSRRCEKHHESETL